MNRKDLILKLIVEQFIKTAEPVSSKSLREEFELEYSSATIRNEMMALELEGMIEKPHTSAGRVPSAAGYRYYVDNLRTHRMDQALQHQLQLVFERRHLNVEEVIREGCEILSQMTNLTVVMLGKSALDDFLTDVQLIQVSPTSAMGVFVLGSGEVATKKFALPEAMTINELQNCLKVFKDRLAGTSLQDLPEKLATIRPLVADYVESYELLFKTFLSAILSYNNERISVFGATNLFSQVEFSNDGRRLKELLALLESNSIWSALPNGKPVEVAIAHEALADDVSVVRAELHDLSHSIALVGPTRMNYDQVIEAFNYLQQRLALLLRKGDK